MFEERIKSTHTLQDFVTMLALVLTFIQNVLGGQRNSSKDVQKHGYTSDNG